MSFVDKVQVVWDSEAQQVVSVFPEDWEDSVDSDGKKFNPVEDTLNRLAGVRPEGGANLYSGVLHLTESKVQKADREAAEAAQKKALRDEKESETLDKRGEPKDANKPKEKEGTTWSKN